MRGDWTSPDGPSPATPSASASTLARSVGVCDLAELDGWHDELVLAVEELSIDAGRLPIIAVGDPLVAVVRALGIIARRHPAAMSAAAALVVAGLAADLSSRGSPSRV